METEEIFRSVPSYEGLYEVSNKGNIKSVKRNIIMKPYVRNGYKSLNLSREGVEKSHSIHRLVAQVFIENQDSSKTVVNHKDGDKSNNDVSNLEWSTHLENAM